MAEMGSDSIFIVLLPASATKEKTIGRIEPIRRIAPRTVKGRRATSRDESGNTLGMFRVPRVVPLFIRLVAASFSRARRSNPPNPFIRPIVFLALSLMLASDR